jgi:hypothetical protein
MRWTVNRYILNGIGLVSLVTILALGYYGCYALQEWGEVGATIIETGDGIHETLDTINRPCGDHRPCGTLADAAKTLGTIRGSFGQVEVAARHENKQLTLLDAQERQLFVDLHGTAAQAQGTLSALTGTSKALTDTVAEGQRTIRAAQPLLSSLDATAKASTDAVNSLNIRINDPHVATLMRHLDETSEHVAGVTANLDKMSGHIEHQVDAPPTWKSRIAGMGMDIAKIGIWFFTK